MGIRRIQLVQSIARATLFRGQYGRTQARKMRSSFHQRPTKVQLKYLTHQGTHPKMSKLGFFSTIQTSSGTPTAQRLLCFFQLLQNHHYYFTKNVLLVIDKKVLFILQIKYTLADARRLLSATTGAEEVCCTKGSNYSLIYSQINTFPEVFR